MQKTRNTLLFVVGILMIIFGGLGIILNIIALLGVSLLVGNAGLLTVALILSLAGCTAELVAGILGAANADKPQKAGACIMWGIITTAMAVLGNIITMAAGGAFNPFGLFYGLLLPILYLVGAFQLKSKT